MSWMKGSVLIAVLFLVAPLAMAADPPPMKEIVRLVEANLAASQALDVNAVLDTIHPESPSREAVREMSGQLAGYELEMTPAVVELVGTTGDYVLVRVLQHTRRISGPAFMDNALDGVWALREHEGKWLYWSQMVLSIEGQGRRTTSRLCYSRKWGSF